MLQCKGGKISVFAVSLQAKLLILPFLFPQKDSVSMFSCSLSAVGFLFFLFNFQKTVLAT